MDNYICIDGVKVLLTDSQISELRAVLEKKETKKNSPFERQKYGDKYYYITNTGEVDTDSEANCDVDSVRHDNANYCTDKELLRQRALEEILARLLWRYSMEHGGDKIDWSNNQQSKFVIHCDAIDHSFYITSNENCQIINTTYFIDYEIALNAIKEVVEPFMKEYPDFRSYKTHSARGSKGE